MRLRDMRTIRKGRVALIAGALAALLTVASVPARAEAGTLLEAHASGPAMSDGSGTVAFPLTPGTVHVLRSDGARYDADVRGICDGGDPSIGAVGGEELLLLCPGAPNSGGGKPLLLDLATRALREVAGAAALIATNRLSPYGWTTFNDVGAYGVGFHVGAYHGSNDGALNWQTGVRSYGVGGAPARALDLDSPELSTPLCSPLQRVATRYETDGPEFYPYAFEAPYGVAKIDRDAVPALAATLTLERCGSARRLILSRDDVRDLQLKQGIISWDVGVYAGYAYLTGCDAQIRWGTEGAVRVAHLVDAVVLSEAASASGPWHIRRVGIAGICGQVRDAWTLTTANGMRTARASATVAATLRLHDGDATATLRARPRGAVVSLRVQLGTSLRLYPGVAADDMRWKLAAHRWRALDRTSGAWRLPVPPLAAPRTLIVGVRFRQGGSARFALRLVPPDGGAAGYRVTLR
jgi:hypothetical protein